ncbi:hypothetical protein GUITHDRAFT_112146 [Guillardia theta CCMP2712]|uniref:NAD(P)-binding domain-containing protein n=1 Tax=Guillardia theta (strain CCMP2712) TaxID=905079 RepID=L1J0W4_GUITC|nr:hypothetical protein GUITHDRAFT_112146 [Guillardia theta CCMP2712]EKX41730.1 hypothetical protein GUITHDRAFT_112146 [Guillardia theta CCMP2712]|eukprot:XP_005828710.1 hypothetical protein GUITHDRAFT_112146 [Guillardia theta CCMP2712]
MKGGNQDRSSEGRETSRERPIGIIGASRGTGLQCVLYAAKLKIHCRAIVRNPQESEELVNSYLPVSFRQYVQYCKADVTSPKTLSKAVNGCRRAGGRGLIFAATATAGWRLPIYDNKDTPPHIDFEGSVAAATAAAAEGVARFVLISSLAITRPSHPMHLARNSLMGRIMDWKLLGEQGVSKVYEAVSKSSTNKMSYTIVRPGYLNDDPPGGPTTLLVDTGDNLSGSISRADLAALCVEAIFRPDAHNLTLEVVNGKQGGNYPVCNSYDQLLHVMQKFM